MLIYVFQDAIWIKIAEHYVFKILEKVSWKQVDPFPPHIIFSTMTKS